MKQDAFTVIELIIVMAIILVLAGLILATSGYVQKKGARSRAEAEIAAMSAALESCKADNGTYPTSSATTALDPTTVNSQDYKAASKFLYGELSGDRNGDGTITDADKISPTDPLPTSYMSVKPQMLLRNQMSQEVGPGNLVTALRDPFGNSYGYSTLKAFSPTGPAGYNPTFDLWSVADGAAGTDQSKWVKNW